MYRLGDRADYMGMGLRAECLAVESMRTSPIKSGVRGARTTWVDMRMMWNQCAGLEENAVVSGSEGLGFLDANQA